MSLETELYNELFALRETLRNEYKRNTGQNTPVCSDEALHIMAQRIPR